MAATIDQWFAGTSGGEGATSPDASSWTIQSSFATAFGAHAVRNACHNRDGGAAQWIVVGAAGAMATATTDDTSWSALSPGFGSSDINAIAYDGVGKWVAAGANKKARYSTDGGSTWNACTLPGGWSSSTVLVGVAHDFVGTWVLIGNDGSTPVAAHSSDGITFSNATLPGVSGTLVAIVNDHIAGYFGFAVGTSGGDFVTSSDGTSWTVQTNAGNSPYGPSSLACDESLAGPHYYMGSASSHCYDTVDFSSYVSRDAAPGAGPTNLAIAADNNGNWGVGGTGFSNFDHSTTGSSLGSAVSIGFSSAITALAHSNHSNKIGIRDALTGTDIQISIQNSIAGISELVDGSSNTDNIFTIVKAINETADITVSLLWKQIANVLEAVTCTSIASGQAGFRTAVVDTAIAKDILSVVFFLNVAEAVASEDSVGRIYTAAEAIIERAAAVSSAGSLATWLNAIIVVGNASAGAAIGWYESIGESMDATVTQANALAMIGAIAESMVVEAIIAQNLGIPIMVAESIQSEDALAVHMDMMNFVQEGGVVAVQLSLGDSDYTAWVMNTQTLGATQYTNFAFNSMMKFGAKYLGVKHDGVYELDGDTDDGVDIPWELRTGMLDIGDGRNTRVPYVYMALRTNGKLVLKVVHVGRDGQKHEYYYNVEARPSEAIRATRAKVGKSLDSRWWQFALSNLDAADLDLAELKFFPVILDRRIN